MNDLDRRPPEPRRSDYLLAAVLGAAFVAVLWIGYLIAY